MTEKRFKYNGCSNTIEFDGKSIQLDSYGDEIVPVLNELNDENEELKKEISDASELLDGLTIPELLDLLQTFEKENEQLKSEITMLKTTIGRNEAYIKRLTHKSEWQLR